MPVLYAVDLGRPPQFFPLQHVSPPHGTTADHRATTYVKNRPKKTLENPNFVLS